MSTAVVFAIGASFLASIVEFVEAFTIILAVGVSRSWRSALYGAAVAALALAAIIAIFGVTLVRIDPNVLRIIIGTLVLVFGLKWIRKSIMRFAGIKGMHDEGEIYAEETEALSKLRRGAGFDWPGFMVSFQGTLLEGLEVVFIVITFGLNSGSMTLPAYGALAALVFVALVGVMVRKPLEQVPENTMKFVVGIMLTTFGTFWAGEGLGIAWPVADLIILPLIALYLLYSWAAVRALRSTSSALVAKAPAPRADALLEA